MTENKLIHTGRAISVDTDKCSSQLEMLLYVAYLKK